MRSTKTSQQFGLIEIDECRQLKERGKEEGGIEGTGVRVGQIKA